MINTCDPNMADWTPNGAMFVVKDQKRFAKEVISLFFNHENFASFDRQLNTYGFRKVQVKPVRNSDIDESTMNHVTFFNENFKRDSPKLHAKIQRPTKGLSGPTVHEQQHQIDSLKGKVQQLNARLEIMERRFSYLEKHSNRDRSNAPVKASSAAIDVEERFSNLEKPINLDRPNARVKASSAAIDVGEIGRRLSMPSIDSFHLSLASMTSYEQPSNPDRVSLASTKVAYDHSPITIPGRDYPSSALKVPPATLAPRPETKIGLPPGAIPNCISTMPTKAVNDSSLLPTTDRKAFNSVLNSSPATLAPHPKTKIGLPPSSIPDCSSSNKVANGSSLLSTPDRIVSNSVLNWSPAYLALLLQERILSYCFTLRRFSNESDTFPLGIEIFDKPIPDEKDNNWIIIDRVEPDDGIAPFYTQNV